MKEKKKKETHWSFAMFVEFVIWAVAARLDLWKQTFIFLPHNADPETGEMTQTVNLLWWFTVYTRIYTVGISRV